MVPTEPGLEGVEVVPIPNPMSKDHVGTANHNAYSNSQKWIKRTFLVKRLGLGWLAKLREIGAEKFLLLDETDQEPLWDYVKECVEGDERDRYWEEYLQGIHEHPPWHTPPRPRPTMRPALLPADGLTLEEALRRLGRVRERRNEWLAYCPAHDTHHYSLVVSESDYKPGTPVFYCYAGCTHQQVKDALLARAAA
jgi:hypothetical protein